MALFSPAPRSTVLGRGVSPAPQLPVKLGLHLAHPVVHSPGACVVRRVSQAFSLFSFSFLSCRSRSSLSGNCCASEHELLVTVNARGSDPGTVTGVTWLLSSFSLRAGPSTFLSSSPGSSTTTVRSWGVGFYVSRWGKKPSGSLSPAGCPVEEMWPRERLFSFRVRWVREQMQLGHGGCVTTPVCSGRIILPPVSWERRPPDAP